MFSGKSTELIRRIRRFQSIGKDVCIINHQSDTRTGDKVETHYGDGVEALKYVHLMNFVNGTNAQAYDVICVDEGQFFGDLYQAVMMMVEGYRLQVVVAGLSGDFRREPFGDILRLIIKAEDVLFCKAYCGICKDGTLAPFTKRISEGKKQVDVGDSDKYTAVCRACYLNN
jgi:thymidine kinase